MKRFLLYQTHLGLRFLSPSKREINDILRSKNLRNSPAISWFFDRKISLRSILNRMRKTVNPGAFGILLWFYPWFVFAAPTPLPAEQAFQMSVSLKDRTVLQVHWQMPEGYYLYRDRIKLQAVSKQVLLGALHFPAGHLKKDPFFGKQTVYFNQLLLPVAIDAVDQQAQVHITYQGCTTFGFCYPPTTKVANLNFQTLASEVLADESASQKPVSQTALSVSFPWLNRLMQAQGLGLIFAFLGFGVLLSFTPCVLPMIPILSGIVLGQKQTSKLHNFWIALSYVLGISFAYSMAGIAAAALGSTLQASFQTPFFLIGTCLFLFVLAGLLLTGYDLRLPDRWQQWLNDQSSKLPAGQWASVFLMGVLSALIVSPCVTAPLMAALGIITQTGNVVLGGVALFALGFGTGIPLLLVGTWGPALLPKTGPWMGRIKIVIGILLIAVALSLLVRVIPSKEAITGWTRVHTLAELEPLMKQAQRNHQRVMIDFYADWCVACRELDKTVLADTEVVSALKTWLRIKADITANDSDNKVLMRAFQVIAPPALIFFDEQGQEITSARWVGEIDKTHFLALTQSTLP